MSPSDAAVLPESAARRLRRALWRGWWRLRRALAGRTGDVCVETVHGFRLVVLPGVFNGVRLRTGAFLTEAIDLAGMPAGARVLDLGTGSGLGAIVAARAGARVTATDINPDAVRCAQVNAFIHHLDRAVDIRLGDLFAPVAGERFDLILFNPPYYRGVPRNAVDSAWRSADVFERFLGELPDHLTADGRALVVLSSDGDIGANLAAARHLRARATRERDLGNETLTVYEIRPAS